MNPTLSRHCPECRVYGSVDIKPFTDLSCPECNNRWGRVEVVEDIFANCPVCTCRQFYRHKDFNQAIGCAVMAIGIILVPWTYGLSLPLFWGIDLLIHRAMREKELAACYRCGSEFRGLPIPKRIKIFMHHIGLKYDKYR